MTDQNLYKTDPESIDLLKYIFDGAYEFYKAITPDGWVKSDFVLLLHPTPEQQYTEHKRMRDNINRLIKKKEDWLTEDDIKDFDQDDLTEVSGFDDFLYILGLSTYDIFSNNHDVTGSDNKIYDLGSLRGSGRFIADFLNVNYYKDPNKYGYMDFYMGTIWIRDRGNLIPFYEFVFQKLKESNCNWIYSFPRLYLFDPGKLVDQPENQQLEDYKPEQAIQKQLEADEKDSQTKNFQDELDKAYHDEYEEAKYRPLNQLVQAYKNIYGVLPEGHPQKEFE